MRLKEYEFREEGIWIEGQRKYEKGQKNKGQRRTRKQRRKKQIDKNEVGMLP